MWEESPDGGIWITKLKKNDNVDLMWENLLLAIIGEQFGDLSVVGISLSQRTKDRLIQVWLKDAQNPKVKAKVSNLMRHYLKLDPEFTTLYFKEHQNSIKDNSTMKNALGYKFEKKKSPSDEPTTKSRDQVQKDEPRSYQKHSNEKERRYNDNVGP